MISAVLNAPRVRRRAQRAALIGLVAGVVAVWVAPTDGPRAGVDPGVAAPLEIKPLSPHEAVQRSLAEAPTAPHADDARAYRIPAAEVDPAAAEVDGDSLVQVLGDGTRLELTLDPMLQRAAQRSLAKYKVGYGVVVAVRPATGEILALAEHAELRPDLRHLALQAEGPAASIFKLVSSAALLEYGGLAPTDTICTHGGDKGISLAHLRPNSRLDTRCQTFGEALGASNNAAFGRWADLLLRPAQLQAMAERFLFNRRLPFLWGVAVSRAAIPTGSQLGLARASAGFEGTSLSPLHAALITAAIANGGEMMAPHLVRSASRDGEELYRAEPTPLTRVVEAETAAKLLAMMVETTTTGTGQKFFERRGKPRLPGISVAGKTGSLSAHDTGVARFYSWFVAAAPADAPEIAIASLIVNGEEWTVKGIVPARELLDSYFLRKETGTTASR